jgi:hypothetical protein
MSIHFSYTPSTALSPSCGPFRPGMASGRGLRPVDHAVDSLLWTTCTRRKIEDLPKGDGEKQGARVRVFISGLIPQGIGGGAWSSFVEDANLFWNDVRNGFEGAEAAGEQQAGSTAASRSSPRPAAARSRCLHAQLRQFHLSRYRIRLN